jgi:hypothetical protein
MMPSKNFNRWTCPLCPETGRRSFKEIECRKKQYSSLNRPRPRQIKKKIIGPARGNRLLEGRPQKDLTNAFQDFRV